MASVSEILDNFNSGLYKTKDELENALQKIHECVALVSDSISDLNAYEEMVDAFDRKSSIKMDKTIYIGFCVLYLSKMLMYDFDYKMMLPKYGERLSLAYTDTDSFIYCIKTGNIYEDMLKNLDTFDTSNYPQDHPCYSVRNKKVIGKFKDECDGK
ncbi:hypothetical protein J437_LFUL005844 [Ladona fulva]|uniref:Uncharacterized protein n=1 Tax=Ladona fulva TaxID=123851 RepID=A0A8K0K8E4_LADFU|nr:hypothetical protein J437_LFUL005844 [Ladona fulva]